jgi:CheY-like chemotaxis protein
MQPIFKTCLLIDDSIYDSLINQIVIESTQCFENVVVQQFPLEALAAMREGRLKPRVIFLDIRMPLMDGFEFLKEFNEIDIDKQEIKIFLLSSSIDPNDVKKAKENKYITDVIRKPLTPAIIKALAA